MIIIQKYRAKIIDTDQVVIGYISEIRKYYGSGNYDNNDTDYLISVTEKSMPGGKYGTFLVDKDTIEEFN